MSFASETKKELCGIQNNGINTMRAELYGFLLFAKSFKRDNISFSTESLCVARRFSSLITECTGAISEMRSSNTNKKSGAMLYTVTLPDSNDIKKVFSFVMHSENEISLRINKAVTDGNECVSAFLRGAFLCSGSVSDPKREYHLEIVVPFFNLSKDLCAMISRTGEEIGDCPIKPGTVMRKSNYVVYIKDKDAVAELLAIMGAANSNIGFVQEIIHKDIINRTNRRINSEIANMNKTAKVAALQLEAIEKIKKNNLFNMLPEDLKELAQIRTENPEMSLRELGESLNPPISRSGVNHRMSRLLDFSDKIKEK